MTESDYWEEWDDGVISMMADTHASECLDNVILMLQNLRIHILEMEYIFASSTENFHLMQVEEDLDQIVFFRRHDRRVDNQSIQNIGSLGHLPQLIVYLQRQNGKSAAGRRGAKCKIRARRQYSTGGGSCANQGSAD